MYGIPPSHESIFSLPKIIIIFVSQDINFELKEEIILKIINKFNY